MPIVGESTIKRSDDIIELAKALAVAQGKMEAAVKDSTNPGFRNAKYADLASVWAACREPLSSCGLSIIQMPEAQGPSVTLTTLLLHVSGQWISSSLTMTAEKNTPHGIGSCITYTRRYALMSVVGIAPDDDDGNAASNVNPHETQQNQKTQTPKIKPTDPESIFVGEPTQNEIFITSCKQQGITDKNFAIQLIRKAVDNKSIKMHELSQYITDEISNYDAIKETITTP